MNRIALYIFSLILAMGLFTSAGALTTLINPTGDGGLETGTTFAANGWTIDASTTLNRYWVGNAPTVYAGSRCSFIDADGAAPWNNTNGAVVKHMYRDVTFPAGETNISLSFYYKTLNPGVAEDGFKVYLCATSFTPVSGTLPTGTQIGSTWYDTATAWTLSSITVPASYAGTSARLVFSWQNDNTNPRGIGALDNISLTSDLADPATFTATTASSSQINLAWTKNVSNDDVMVAWNTTNTFGTPVNGTTYGAGNTITGGGTVIYNGSGTSFNHTLLIAGTIYYYKTWSHNATPNYSPGIIANATTSAVANPPTFTATAASISQINLAWTLNAASNNVIVAWNTTNTFGTPVGGTTYSAGGTISGGGTILYVGSALSYNHTLLHAGTIYYYKAWSLDATPNYSTGITANATTTAIVNPPTFTATAAGSAQINLAWTKNPSANNVMVAWNTTNTFGAPVYGTTYTAGNTIAGGGTVLYNGSGTSFNHTLLTAGTIYYYKAWSLVSTPDYSAGVTANATTAAVANPPTFSATTASISQINLAWTLNAASNNVIVAWSSTSTFGTPVGGTTYSVGGTISGGGTILYIGNGLSYNHTLLHAGTIYYYKAWSLDATPNYSTGMTANATTTAIVNPPTFTATAASSAQINLAWTKNPSANNVMVAWNTTNTFGAPVYGTSYVAGNVITGGGTVLYNGSGTSFNHTLLTAGTIYYYKAWSLVSTPDYSSGVTANATTATVANPPTFTATAFSFSQNNLAWTLNAASNNVIVAWSSTSTFGTPVGGTSYSVGGTISGGGTILYIGNGTSYNHTSLSPATVYYYKAWSLDARPNYSTGMTANATTLSPTVTVAVGTGAATVAILPITAAVAYSYSQQIYTQAQINTAGTITKLRFYYTSGGTTNSTTWDVFMGHTTKTAFTSTTDWIPSTSMTKVFSGIVTFPAAGNWLEITLSTQFSYNNTNNLVIAVDENTAGNAASACNWGSFTSGANTGIVYSNATTNPYPSFPPTATARYATINRIQLDITNSNVAPVTVNRLLATNTSKTQDVTITNTGNSDIIITNVTDTAAWLTYSVTTPVTISSAKGSYTFPLTLNATGLGAGTNTTNLLVTTNAGVLTIPVTLKVITGPFPTNPRHVDQFENARGAIIRYPLGIPYTMVRDMADDDSLYCVVSSANQAAAITAFTSNAVNMAHVRWIVAPSDSYWSRDWGPMSVYEGVYPNRDVRIVDFHYNRNARTNDDALNPIIANFLGMPYYFMPLSYTGGDNLTDGYGKEFGDWFAYQQNDGNAATGAESGFTEIYSYKQTEFEDVLHIFLGMEIGGFNYFDDPTGTYIHHTDTYAKLLSARVVLVARVPVTDSRYAAYEALAAHWASLTSSAGDPYIVYRVDEPNSEPYTNSFIFNNEVFVPFMGTAANDNAALAVYQSALPTYTIRGYIAGTNAWVNTDAIHCRVNTIFADDEEQPPLPVELSSFTATVSATNHAMLTWVTQSETNVSGFNIYRGTVNDLTQAEQLNVFIDATNTSQMQSYVYQDNEVWDNGTYYYWLESSDFDGSNNFYGPVSIVLDFETGQTPEIPINTGINSVYPNPFNPTTTVSYSLKTDNNVDIEVYNLKGQLVRRLIHEDKAIGTYRATWDGRDDYNTPCSSGLYNIVLRVGKDVYNRKAVLMK